MLPIGLISLLLASATHVHATRQLQTKLDKRDQRIGELWLVEDTYEGPNFFDNWDFWHYGDPTHGLVNYTDKQTSFDLGLAYVQNNVVIMKTDAVSSLPQGGLRNSVRISSQKNYTQGLFILDTNHAPWGCGIWPAWWTVNPNWPWGGEIDIIEGVHDNTHNQVTFHTAPGCQITKLSNFTGTVLDTNCDATLPGNAGCGVTDWSRVSYGPDFDAAGGGVYAMLWDDSGIAVWYFYRASIPTDLLQKNPQPSGWSEPSAFLSPANCNLTQYFYEHQITFDITLCGDWAGNSYATSGCPGTCDERIMNGSNFVNSSWSINSVTVYRKQLVFGATSGVVRISALGGAVGWIAMALLTVFSM